VADEDNVQSLELELARRLAAGDEAALEAFYRRYVDRVYGFVYTRLCGDRPAAEEVTQETFLAVLRTVGSYRGEASLFAWLCTIARHKIADHYRRARRRDESQQQLQVVEEPGSAPGELEARLLAEEQRQRVLAALGRLPPHYRQALALKYLDGQPVRAIAAELGLSPKATESLLTRAREALRLAYLQSEEGVCTTTTNRSKLS